MNSKPFVEITEKSYELLLALLCIKEDEVTDDKIENGLVELGLTFCPDAIPEIYHP